MKKIFENTKVLICIGSGGVGKTTISAALGVLAAETGKKVLVLTIDPSKRLAGALGIEQNGDIIKVPGQSFQGELYAGVIEHKKTFDDFVKRAAKKTESANKILSNKLYQQLSTSLSGSQEFTSLEKLYSCYEQNKFDLIILDTPPAQHAIEFLRAPQKLAALFNEGIAKWFREPTSKKKSLGFITSFVQMGTKQVFRLLETLTGSQFIRELSDFFLNIEKWQGDLEDRTIQGHKLLVHPKTKFILVTAFDEAKLKEADLLAKEIRRGGYNLFAVFLNRSLPILSREDVDPDLIGLYNKFENYNQEHQLQFENFQKNVTDIFNYKISEVQSDISNFSGLINFAKLLDGELN